MKKIALLSSGGDAPGMNACIRSVVRTAAYYGMEVDGIIHGYEGMIDNEFISLAPGDVAGIIHRGGTILKTARSERFRSRDGRDEAYANLRRNGVEGLIVIGGDGTFRGACDLMAECDIPVVGIPGTIDNDLEGTDFTIGYDTAINTVIEVVDKIRDTAESHNRLFIVEVMGKDAGLIALRSGIGAGAEAIMIPEISTDIVSVMERFEKGRRDKSSYIIIVAEGDSSGGAYSVAERIEHEYPGYDTRVSILGHVQRGGSPSCMDRVLASRLGMAAVEALLEGKGGVMAGIIHRDLVFTPLEKAVKHIREPNPHLIRVLEILST